MNCPTCDGALDATPADELTTHYNCPTCRPDYTPHEPGAVERVLFVMAFPLVVVLAKLAGWALE